MNKRLCCYCISPGGKGQPPRQKSNRSFRLVIGTISNGFRHICQNDMPNLFNPPKFNFILPHLVDNPSKG